MPGQRHGFLWNNAVCGPADRVHRAGRIERAGHCQPEASDVGSARNLGHMTDSGPSVGRIVTDAERSARMADEAAAAIDGEELRSAFAIGPATIITAWHCVAREFSSGEHLWFRMRDTRSDVRAYIYLPMRLTNYNDAFDVAALHVDAARLAEVNLSAGSAADLLTTIAMPVGTDVQVNDETQVLGFPESATAADSDTNSAKVVAVRVAMGEVTGLKLHAPSCAAVSPVDPRGLSGGPVLKATRCRRAPLGGGGDYPCCARW